MAQDKITYADRMRADGKFPAVLRFAPMRPSDAAGMVAHGERQIGNLDHVDPSRSHLNRTLIGSPAIAHELVEESREMAEFNLRSNILGLTQMGRKKDLQAARKRGRRDPWAEQKKSRGPLREVVLTVHRDFFRADHETPADRVMEFIDDEGEMARFDTAKIDRFVDASHAFLVEQFGDAVRYLRADLDEQSIHLQGILVDTVEEPKSKRYAHGRKLYRLSHHPLIGGVKGDPRRGYELAQDSVADFFSQPQHRDMNIVRGEGRAAAAREAKREVSSLREAAAAAALFGEDEDLPAGSPNAQAMLLLKRKMAEAVAEKGSAERIRKDQAQGLALDYLEMLGVISVDDRRDVSTRRARQALLDRHAETYGTAAEIIAAPDEVAERVLSEARARREADDKLAEIARHEADKRAAAERARLDREAEEERRRRAADLERREADLSRRERLVRDAVARLQQFAGAVRKAAVRLGLARDPVVQAGLEAGDRLDQLSTKAR